MIREIQPLQSSHHSFNNSNLTNLPKETLIRAPLTEQAEQ